MDTKQSRFNMIEQQLRPAGVLAADVLNVLTKVKRENFVPPIYRHLAFAETNIPLGHGAHMLSPDLEAFSLQALAIQPDETVLEIGTGSGYMAALLGKQARQVVSYEIEPALAATARASLEHAHVSNVHVITGDGLAAFTNPLPNQAGFDVILLSGAVAEISPALLKQLKPGGRLFAVTGTRPAMHATLVHRYGDQCQHTALFETDADYLRGASPVAQFSF